MKAIMFYLLVISGIISLQAQEIIELDPANVNYSQTTFVKTGLNEYQFKIDKEHAGKFTKNPIEYVKNNFNINKFIAEIENQDYDSYKVNFRSSKGFLNANYDRDGNLVSTFQQFKNVYMPKEIRDALYNNYTGWSVLKNKYVASGKLDQIDRAEYKIRLERGNKKQNVKLSPNNAKISGIVSN